MRKLNRLTMWPIALALCIGIFSFTACREKGIVPNTPELVTAVDTDIATEYQDGREGAINEVEFEGLDDASIQEVNADLIPPDSANVYYLIKERSGSGKETKEILQDLLKSGLVINSAWDPMYFSPCMVLNAATALFVELEKPDGRIAEFGFIPEPGLFIINCGIKRFKQYSWVR